MLKYELNSLKGCLIMLDYCDKCGWIWQRSIQNENNGICGNCEICGNQLKPVPDYYFEDPNFKLLLSDEMEHKLIEELVKTSPNFDQYYFDNAINIKGQKDDAFNAKMEHGRAVIEGKDKGNPYGITCPNCKATNVRKITIANKAVHTSIFGIWSIGRNAKNYHCDHCGSEF